MGRSGTRPAPTSRCSNGWIDFNGNGVWDEQYAESEVIDPDGMQDEFYFIARDPGQIGTRIAVVFHEAAELSVAYDADTRTLHVFYVPDETTVGSLAALVNKGHDPGLGYRRWPGRYG